MGYLGRAGDGGESKSGKVVFVLEYMAWGAGMAVYITEMVTLHPCIDIQRERSKPALFLYGFKAFSILH